MVTQDTPRINVNDDTVEIIKWLVAPFERVQKGQDLLEVGTSKATVILQAEKEGFVSYRWQVGDMVRVGSPLVTFFSTVEQAKQHVPTGPAPVSTTPSAAAAPGPSGTGQFSFLRTSSLAESYFVEHPEERARWQGQGLVTSRMLRGSHPTVPVASAAPAASSSVVSSTPSAPTVDPQLIRTTQRLGKAKQAEIQALTIGEAGNITSTLTVELPSLRIQQRLRERGALNRSLLPLILFEFAQALDRAPAFNAFFRDNEIHFYRSVDLGVALDLGQGLKVVTLRGATALMPMDFLERLTDLSMKYVGGQLTLEDLTGSTVTVSDLSVWNIRSFRPLISQNQSCILGIGGDASATDHPLSLNLTFDHRVSTGREAAEFLNDMKARLLAYGD